MVQVLQMQPVSLLFEPLLRDHYTMLSSATSCRTHSLSSPTSSKPRMSSDGKKFSAKQTHTGVRKDKEAELRTGKYLDRSCFAVSSQDVVGYHHKESVGGSVAKAKHFSLNCVCTKQMSVPTLTSHIF